MIPFQVVHFVQKSFGYLLEIREEKVFINMQQSLQQAIINDRERRILLSQLESRIETQKDLVLIYCISEYRCFNVYHRSECSPHIKVYCQSNCSYSNQWTVQKISSEVSSVITYKLHKKVSVPYNYIKESNEPEKSK